MTAAMALAVILPLVMLVTALLTRAAACRSSHKVTQIVCALSALPVTGALVVAAEVGGASARLISLLAILMGSIALVAGFGLVDRASRSDEDAR